MLLGGASLMPQPSPGDKAFEIACLQFGIQGPDSCCGSQKAESKLGPEAEWQEWAGTGKANTLLPWVCREKLGPPVWWAEQHQCFFHGRGCGGVIAN